MSKEFIQKGFNSRDINKASQQETQLTYFLDSSLQDITLNQAYLDAWAERKYQTSDYFLNWVRLIFKTDNFLVFFKYLRYPLPSAKIIKNEIEPQLRRVFNSDDEDFKYDVTGADDADFVPDLKIKKFNEEIFNKILYKHNSLIIEDLKKDEANTPFRFFLDVDDVVSILPAEDGISQIAIKASIARDGKIINGFLYIDSEVYRFYDQEYRIIEEKPHDLGRTPVNFISPNKYKDSFVIRESIYTYLREELEEYVFLKTLQRMTEPNGAIPVTTMVDTEKKVEDSRGSEHEPSSNNIMGSQKAQVFSENEGKGPSDLNTGTIHYIDPESIRNNDGSINMDVVTNWINFHFIPTEALEYLNTRIQAIERSIISTVVGDVVESNEASKNQLQIEKSISVLENNLVSLAESFNRIRTLSDSNMLGLKYGPGRVNEVFIHYGTDFFLEGQTKLFADLEKAPNTLERKNIIKRISQNRYKNNIDQSFRQKILYELLPYCSDKDFDAAKDTNTIGDVNLQYQLRFNYWISQFEAIYGDIVTFWNELEVGNSQKTALIDDLIKILIKEDTKENESTSVSVES